MKQKNTAVDLTDLSIGILILGITVTIGASVLLNLQDNQRTNLDILTTSNESIDINATGVDTTFNNGWVTGITTCYSNVTGSGTTQTANSTIVAANYTSSVNDFGVGSITNTTAANFNDAACTYTRYDVTSRDDYTLAGNASTGIAEFGNWFDIIVIVGIAGLILALIFMAFGNRGQEANVSY